MIVAVEPCEITILHPERVEVARAQMPSSEAVTRLADSFQALADPTRVRIIAALDSGELCVCDLSALLGMTQSAVSHQLRLLRALGLVRARKDGRVVFYTLDDEHIRGLFHMALEHAGHREGEA